jgi:hypothetical protein
MGTVDTDYQKVMKEELPALNRSLTDSNVTVLVAPVNAEPAKKK